MRLAIVPLHPQGIVRTARAGQERAGIIRRAFIQQRYGIFDRMPISIADGRAPVRDHRAAGVDVYFVLISGRRSEVGIAQTRLVYEFLWDGLPSAR